jgi:gamma-glutamyl hydrolase
MEGIGIKSEIKIILILILSLICQIKGNTRLPLVAIVSVPEEDITMVAAKYVRWLEASGADSVVIHPWHTQEQITEILNKVNGILIQGGEMKFGFDSNLPYFKTLQFIITKIIEMSDNPTSKVNIPLIGIDHGFFSIQFLISGDYNILSDLKSYNLNVPLNFDSNYLKTSKLFSLLEENDFNNLRNLPLTYHLHKQGVSPHIYEINEKLRLFYKITTTAKTDTGNSFISSIEAINYPIYGLQFLPEALPFEKNQNLNVNKNLEAIRISRALGNSFIQLCKQNNNTMNNEEYNKYDYIYPYQSFPNKLNGSYYYTFKKSSTEKLKFIE